MNLFLVKRRGLRASAMIEIGTDHRLAETESFSRMLTTCDDASFQEARLIGLLHTPFRITIWQVLFAARENSIREVTMNELWAKYEAWLETHFPDVVKALNPGARESDIDALETAIGVKLPEDYRACLRIHNGQEPDAVGLLWSNEFLSTSRILDEWQLMKQLLDAGHFPHSSESSPKDAIKPDWWNPRWIPVTSDGSGNLQCLDLAPGAAGSVGQVIDFDHETVHRCVIAPSFWDAMKCYVDEVLAGGYGYSDDYGRLMALDEL